MMGREEFEKWAVSEGRSIKPASEYSPQVYASSASNNALDGWNARQPEIDALNAEVGKLKAEKLQLAYKLNAAQSNLFTLQQGQYEMPNAAMKETK